jgi:hypothetical protein
LCYTESRKDDGSVAESVRVEDMVQASGIWLPARVVHPDAVVGDTYVVSEIKYGRVNAPLTAADFALEFPPGTFVEDHVLNIAYSVPGPEDADTGALKDILDGMVAEAGTVAGRAAASPAPRSGVAPGDRPNEPEDAGLPAAEALWYYVGLGAATAAVALAATLLVPKFRRRAEGLG